MAEEELTRQELDLVREYVDVSPGLDIDREDVARALIAKSTGGRFTKVAPGLYFPAGPHED